METLTFSCHSLGKIMTAPKGKSNIDKYNDAVEALASSKAKYADTKNKETKNKETKAAINLLEKITELKAQVKELELIKDDVILSETAKSYIEEIWLRNNYGYKDTVITHELIKGIVCEKESIELLVENDSEYREKNTEFFKNDYIHGSPDVILEEVIEDVKNSWTLKTFFKADISSDYYWQGQGYMALTGRKKYKLTYVLSDTPPEIVTKEINWQMAKLSYAVTDGCFDKDKIAEQIRKNHTFSHLPIEKRIKVFEFEYNESDINKLYKTIDAARIYYNSISL